MNIPTPAISIVIPAYNEERRLPRSLELIRAYLQKRGWDGEVIVVDDGSTDRTAELVREWQKQIPTLRLVQNGENRGKGFSVRHGMLEARARIAIFTDADLSAPIEEADKLLGVLGGGRYDVAIGSRAVDRRLIAVHESRFRELAGIIFNRMVQLVTGLKFVDTQCGFKAFVVERMKPAFRQQRIEGFGFDPEILFLAKLHGLRTVEVPVRWAHDADTRVRMLRDSLRMFWELLAIRWNWLLGRYRNT
ncbi:MAG TPA: dolichyl-phosphate beta-glucosyltransferase [Candidatus Acidoferrales bacterium]|jgi:glycosyltransferase involved in cell wall biosynthesis|nr:dolichyl-phosphate beta-glucosyltransferase [Candidatus Acidoferrales bacterium]